MTKTIYRSIAVSLFACAALTHAADRKPNFLFIKSSRPVPNLNTPAIYHQPDPAVATELNAKLDAQMKAVGYRTENH